MYPSIEAIGTTSDDGEKGYVNLAEGMVRTNEEASCHESVTKSIE